ncbi:LysE family transporter [Mucilaginibacter lappiensis]|uniref:Threonine/homoserine/homoserine lactone efflux protein n=1 Tax=Mucilaginibacter lappiensis TaxID=354630 RepID=A0A1N7EZN0_9SPHI|nr:LysE family transporter [Mucilaginibacter lappiensis]MBB6112159.1 threonine/homoserine/homoserine lactone efflux protein [Mucilaginibacter lappiensis]MBB6131278.1 threonine/homoserine/homoserine lactone efflux protein [Mucilaginibacter lappiensis]SIR93517.1 Threonine/homoserine/homoserine lactone efflux protein [Mucilaginibacter lappiensis]
MSRYFKLFFAAFSISFIGALPIGTLNTSVANYALNNNFMGAFEFGFAAILVEVSLVRVALFLLDKLGHLQKLFRYLSVVFCFAILYLAYKSLEAAFHMRNFEDTLPFIGMQPFYSGLVLSLLNPLHIPFWLGWTAVLKGRKVLYSDAANYNIYITAIGTGTCLAFLIYGCAGNYLMNVLKAQHNLINWVLGCTLLLTGVVLAYKIIFRKIQLKVA